MRPPPKNLPARISTEGTTQKLGPDSGGKTVTERLKDARNIAVSKERVDTIWEELKKIPPDAKDKYKKIAKIKKALKDGKIPPKAAQIMLDRLEKSDKRVKKLKKDSKKQIKEKKSNLRIKPNTPKVGGGGGGGGGFWIKQKLFGLNPFRQRKLMNKGGMIKKYSYGGRVAKYKG